VPCPSWSLSACILIKQHFFGTGLLYQLPGPLLGLTDSSAKLAEIARLNSLFCLSSVQMELWTGVVVGNMELKFTSTFFIPCFTTSTCPLNHTDTKQYT
jgi:hypothetical protein